MNARDCFRLLLVVSCVAGTVRAGEPPGTGSGVDVAPGDCRGVALQGLFAAPVALVDEAGEAIVTGRAALTAAARPTRLSASARTAATPAEVRCIRRTTAAEHGRPRVLFPFPPPPDAP